MTDVSIEEIKRKKLNIYESVVIMSRRARQINDSQRQEIQAETHITPVLDNRENEDFDDVEIDREALMREHKKFPKPSSLSINELEEEKIIFRYIEPDSIPEQKEEKKSEKKAKEKVEKKSKKEAAHHE